MTELGQRSGSQILRTFLPQQTADLRGGIYRVVEWPGAWPLPVDGQIVRRHLLQQLRPFEKRGNDGGVCSDLRRDAPIEVIQLDTTRGVAVERFPEVWLCQVCKRVGKRRDVSCKCGQRRWGQLHFLGFHECGAVAVPWIKRCAAHDDVQLVSPRSAKASDIRFVCPTCSTETMRGLGFNRTCEGCGQGPVTWNVHKARSVYTPRGTTLINPPRPEKMRELLAAGGARKALDWVLDGITASTPDEMGGKPTRGALMETLVRNGIDRRVAEAMADQAAEEGQVAAHPGSGYTDGLSAEALAVAEHEAVDIALALGDSRTAVSSLVDGPVEPTLARRYREAYPRAMGRGGLAGVDLVERFPVLNVMYGYTRGGGDAGAVRLVPFRNRRGGYRLHGDLSETEALFFRLDPLRVATWLLARGHSLAGLDPATMDATAARVAILGNAVVPELGDEPDPPTVGSDVQTLVHTFAHRVLRQAAVFAGIDRDALSEYLVPLHLGFFIYAAARGDFVLGGLQAMFETELDSLIAGVVDGEHRCPLDPGCRRGSGACSACLHVGEPSCRAFNKNLDRRVLFESNGYLRGLE